MNTSLVIVIGLLLIYCAWLQHRHERAMAAAELRWSLEPRLMFVPTPKPELAEPFELRRERPRFENYGVDVSFAPTIGVGEAVGRLPSFTLQEFGRSLAQAQRSW